MAWYLKVIKNYVGFKGRSRRKEFWMFLLINAIIISLIDLVTKQFSIFSDVYSLVVLLPTIAVFSRRLHDTGKSAWWMLMAFIPIVGIILLLIFMSLDSQAGDNQYGKNPKI